MPAEQSCDVVLGLQYTQHLSGALKQLQPLVYSVVVGSSSTRALNLPPYYRGDAWIACKKLRYPSPAKWAGVAIHTEDSGSHLTHTRVRWRLCA
jgi:hypothetical protein